MGYWHLVLAMALDRAGIQAVDVPMTDLLAGRQKLANFKGLVAAGGFSYGNVLGAGRGWAKSILYRPVLADQFEAFFHRQDTFSLGGEKGLKLISLRPFSTVKILLVSARATAVRCWQS